jgi:hypothetical protein
MGYFEGLAEDSFKSDCQGTRLYYKWGVLGKSYILPDKQKEDEIKNFLILFYKLFHMICLPIFVGVGVIFNFPYAITAVLPFFIWSQIKIDNITKGLNNSTEKLTLKESFENCAKNHGKALFWFMLFFSVIFVLGGIIIIRRADDVESILIGSGNIFFFGACLLISSYMLSKKS